MNELCPKIILTVTFYFTENYKIYIIFHPPDSRRMNSCTLCDDADGLPLSCSCPYTLCATCMVSIWKTSQRPSCPWCRSLVAFSVGIVLVSDFEFVRKTRQVLTTRSLENMRAWRNTTRALVNWRHRLPADRLAVQLPLTALCGYMVMLSSALSPYENTDSDQLFYANLKTTFQSVDRASEWFWLASLMKLDNNPVELVDQAVMHAAMYQFVEMETSTKNAARTLRYINRGLMSNMADNCARARLEKNIYDTRFPLGHASIVYYCTRVVQDL